MRRRWGAALAVLIAAATPAIADAPSPSQEARVKAIAALPWRKGPGAAPLAGNATLKVPPGDIWLDPAGSRRFLQLTGNLPEDGLVTVARADLGWFAVLGFEPSGYVKDDETIDPDALLKSLRDAQAQQNPERQKQGLGTLEVAGWTVPPHYDRASHNLEWGTRLRSPSGEDVNYTTRLLGRRGVTSATLVADPAELPADLAQFRTALAGFSYAADDRYDSYRKGDKVAEYGLAALIAGGAAAAVLMAGAAKGLWVLLAPLWKFLAIGAAAVIGFFRRLFGRGKGDSQA